MTAAPSPPGGDPRDWVARDAAVVWHGFTQMATYGDNRPAHRRARRGPRAHRRRRPPLPRRHLVAVGHHPRPPGPRARRRPAPTSSTGRPLDPARPRQRASSSSWPRPWPRVVPVDGPARPLRLRRGVGGGAGAQDRLPVLGQPGRSRTRTGSSPSATPTTATPSERSRSATVASAPTSSIRCASRSLRTPGYDDPGWADKARGRRRRATPASSPRW